MSPLAKTFFALVLASGSLWAQYDFGKNRVVYHPLAWQVIRTPHGDVHIDRRMESVGPRVAALVEEAVGFISPRMGHRLTRPVPVVIYPSSAEFANTALSSDVIDEGTGGFTEFQRDRVVLPFTGRWDEFRHVLFHEMVHAFELDAVRVAGDNGQNRSRIPGLWVMEGLAEWGSLGEDSTCRTWERDGILAQTFPDLEDLEQPWNMAGRGFYVYKAGQSFFAWMERSGGAKAPGEFYQRLIRTGDTDRAMKETLRMKADEAARRWHQELKERHWPSVAQRRDADLRDRRLTSALRDGSSINFRPVFGTNQQVFLFSNKRVYLEILELDLGDERVKRAVAGADRQAEFESLNILHNTLSLNSNRTRLCFASRSGGQVVFHLYDIARHRLVSRHPLPDSFHEVRASSLSPSGRHIAFVATKNNQCDLWLWDLETSSGKALTEDDFAEDEPTFTPDGRFLIYGGNKAWDVQSFRRDLFIRELATGSERRLTSGGEFNRSPSVSPSGDRVAFISDRGGVSDIWVKHLTSGRLDRITDLAGEALSTSWDEKGRQLAYGVLQGGVYDAFVRDLGTNLEQASLETNFESAVPLAPDNALVAAEQKRFLSIMGSPELGSRRYQAMMVPDFFMFMAGGASTFGVSASAAATFSDMLGEHRLGVQTSLTFLPGGSNLDTANWVEYRSLKHRFNWAASGWFYQQSQYVPDSHTNYTNSTLMNERGWGFTALVSYPFSKYSRLEASITPSFLARSFQGDPWSEITNRYPVRPGAFMPQLRMAWVLDNTLYGMLHPVDNSRAVILAEGAPPTADQGGFFRFIADGRHYLLLGRRASLAARLMLGAALGPMSPEVEFKIGGNGTLDLLYFTSENYPTLHSLPPYSLRGAFMHLLNLEYRFQFLDAARFSWPIPFTIRSLNAVFFLDAGSAFSDIARYRPWVVEGNSLTFDGMKAAMGFGFRFVFLIFPMKVDFSTPWNGKTIRDLKDWDTSVSIGFDF